MTLLPTLVEEMARYIEAIRREFPEIEALAACGNSGTVLAGALAIRLNIPLLIVRKESDKAHDIRRVNGYMGAKAYLFIDDLIDTGKTTSHPIPPKFLGVLLYQHYETGSPRARWFSTPGSLEVLSQPTGIQWTLSGEQKMCWNMIPEGWCQDFEAKFPGHIPQEFLPKKKKATPKKRKRTKAA